MADLLAKGAAWLEDQRTRHATRLVTYERGEASAEVKATVGRTVFVQTDQYGVEQRTEARDYLILAADLVLDSQAILPQRGDRIKEIEGNKTFVYEVLAPGGEPPWRWSDPCRIALRIHTKHIDTVES